jgi:hypothetical protein
MDETEGEGQKGMRKRREDKEEWMKLKPPIVSRCNMILLAF